MNYRHTTVENANSEQKKIEAIVKEREAFLDYIKKPKQMFGHYQYFQDEIIDNVNFVFAPKSDSSLLGNRSMQAKFWKCFVDFDNTYLLETTKELRSDESLFIGTALGDHGKTLRGGEVFCENNEKELILYARVVVPFENGRNGVFFKQVNAKDCIKIVEYLIRNLYMIDYPINWNDIKEKAKLS